MQSGWKTKEFMPFQILEEAANTAKPRYVAGNTNAKENVFEDFIAAGEYLQKNRIHFARIYGTFLVVQTVVLLVWQNHDDETRFKESSFSRSWCS